MTLSTFTPSNWLSSLPTYPFVHLREKKRTLLEKNIKVFDFSIGDPTAPTPDFVIESAYRAMKENANTGYPDNMGTKQYRTQVCAWFEKRFGVTLNPMREIFPSLGAKEAVFAFPSSVGGDAVLIPTPGYPPYYSGALACGKKAYALGLYEKNHFLPDLSSIPDQWAKEASIFWINYPNNPTTTLATETFYKDLIDFCKSYDIIIASDECYSEMYRQDKPASILQYTKKGVIVFQSLSKRSNMTGWRIGFMAGDEEIIQNFLHCKENMDSGCPNFIQQAAMSALQDESHVEAMREEYNIKRAIMQDAIARAGLKKGYSDGAFYIWQPVAEGMSSLDFAQLLLQEETAIVVTPGTALGMNLPDGTNPGEGFVRFALVPTIEDTKQAAQKLIKACKK